ncbi:MAG: DUF6259 domain-containing protein [Lentisphaeria bacterium]|jgi:hypothetical protein|nr:DUF6259 domain-containing protein [Lentisphaeria bacterium]
MLAHHMRPSASLFLRSLGAGLLIFAAVVRGEPTAWDEANRLVLRNERCTMVLGKAQKGAVVSLIDNASGQEFAAQQAVPCLFRLTLSATGDTRGDLLRFSSLDAGDLACSVQDTPGGATATLRFSDIGGRGIEALCTASVQVGDPFVRWRISVSGTRDLTIEEIHFPVMAMPATLGESDEDDAVVLGLNRGGIFRRPGRWPGNARIQAYQPGPLAAQFACHYDNTAGLYAATQDGKGYPKILDLTRTADGLETAWGHLCFHELGTPWSPGYDVVTTTFRSADGIGPADWRDAADLYKEWALRQSWCARTFAERQDLPAWSKRGAALLFCDLRSRWGNAASMEGVADWIERSWPRHFGDAPAPTVIFFGCEGMAAWASPNHLPLFPSDEEFMRGAAALRRAGARVYLAPSSYQWWLTYGRSPDGEFLWDGREEFEKTARPHAVIQRDGTPYCRPATWLEGGETANLCHGDAWSREWFVRLAEELHKRGMDAFHLDQTISGHWPSGGMQNVCYSRDHGHPAGHGLWETETMRAQLAAFRERLPDVLVGGFEEPQELFIQQNALQFHDGWQPWTTARLPGHGPAPVVEYLYHEFLPLYAHIGGSLERLECIADSMVNGNIIQYEPDRHGLPAEPMLPGGGFEDWNGDATPVHWQNMRAAMGQLWKNAGGVARDRQEKHSGESSIRLEGREPGGAVVRRQIRALGPEMTGGKTYRLRAWLKATAEVRNALAVRLTAADGRTLDVGGIDVAGPTDWTEKEIAFALADGTRSLEVVLHVTEPGATVWYDDLVLDEVAADGTAQVALWTETPQNRIYRQWVRLFSGAGRPYLLLGRMLRPPPLTVAKVPCSFAQTRKVQVSRRIPIHFFDAQGKIFRSAYLPLEERDVTAWEKRELAFTVPEGAVRATLFLYLQGKGRIWFDELELTEVGKAGNLLPNGAFEEWGDGVGTPAGWQSPASKRDHGVERTNAIRRDEDSKHGGGFALCLTNDTDDEWTEANVTIPVGTGGLAIGKDYRLGLWLKAQGMGPWRREPPLEVPAIFHNAFRAPDGSEAVVLINVTDQPQAGRLTWDGGESELTLAPWEVRLLAK